MNKLFVITICGMILIFSGCLEKEPVEKISLEETEDVAGKQFSPDALKIAISAMVSPDETLVYYQEILDYISNKTGRDVDLVQRETYAEINDLVKSQYIDAAFVCTGAYIEGNENFKMELLTIPLVNGEPYYYSYLIVPINSNATSLEDLRDKRFAFTDPLSNTGKLTLTYMLILMNETPESFFSNYFYTGSHDKSIEAVAKKMVDGASIDSLIWDYDNKNNPEFTSKTKIIVKSEPFAMPPVVVHPDMDPQLKETLKEILLNMHNDPDGVEILKNIGIDRFIEINDSEYDSVRHMNERVKALNENT